MDYPQHSLLAASRANVLKPCHVDVCWLAPWWNLKMLGGQVVARFHADFHDTMVCLCFTIKINQMQANSKYMQRKEYKDLMELVEISFLRYFCLLQWICFRPGFVVARIDY